MNIKDRIDQDLRDSITLTVATPQERMEQIAVREALVRLDRAINRFRPHENGVTDFETPLTAEQVNAAVMGQVGFYEERMEQMLNPREKERSERMITLLKGYLVEE